MKVAYFSDYARGKWWQLSLSEQMSHLGSEIGRAVRWAKTHPQRSWNAVERALELFALTLDDPRWRAMPWRLRELARLKEEFVDWATDRRSFSSNPDKMLRYFESFCRLRYLEGNPSGKPSP